jgi:hypothetical protein
VSSVRSAVSRNDLREWLQKNGSIGDGPHVNLTEKDRQRLAYWLKALRLAGKIGIDGDYIWLT